MASATRDVRVFIEEITSDDELDVDVDEKKCDDAGSALDLLQMVRFVTLCVCQSWCRFDTQRSNGRVV